MHPIVCHLQAHSNSIPVLEGDKIKFCGLPWKLSRLMPLFVTDTDKGGFAGLTWSQWACKHSNGVYSKLQNWRYSKIALDSHNGDLAVVNHLTVKNKIYGC